MFEDAIGYVAEDLGITKVEARRAILSSLTGLVHTAKESEQQRVIVRGFGTLKLSEIAEREGINPLNKEPMVVEAHKRFSVKPADALKDFINDRTDEYNLNSDEKAVAPVATKKAPAKKAPAKKAAPVAKKAPAKKAPAKKPLKKTIKK